MFQMKIYTFFFPEVSLLSNYVDDFLKNHSFENWSFCIMQIGNLLEILITLTLLILVNICVKSTMCIG